MKRGIFFFGLYGLLASMMGCGGDELAIMQEEGYYHQEMATDASPQKVAYEIDVDALASEAVVSGPGAPCASAVPAAVPAALPAAVPVVPALVPAVAIPVTPVPALPAMAPPAVEFLPGIHSVAPWKANYVGSYGLLPSRSGNSGPFLYSYERHQ